MKQPIVRILGDSHVSTLNQAWASQNAAVKESGLNLQSVTFMGSAVDLTNCFHKMENGRLRITSEEMRERFGPILNKSGEFQDIEGSIALLSLGTHTQSFLLGRRWVTHSLWNTDAAATRQKISVDELRSMFVDLNRHCLSFARDLMAVGYNVTCISSPPVTKRYTLLEMGFSERDLLILDRICRDAMAQEFAELGVAVVPSPDRCQEGGFLKAEYLVDDVVDRHHGNKTYSTEMLADLVRYFGFSRKNFFKGLRIAW